MPQAAIVEFVVAAIVMELTPGPNMTWLALLSAQRGTRAGLLAVSGILLGLALLSAAAIAGAAALITAYPVAYEALRWGGVVFLAYLAIEAWFQRSGEATNRGDGVYFWRGVIVNLLNPKAATVFVILIPSLAGGASAALTDIVWMSVVYLMIATAAHAGIVIFAGQFHRALSDPRRELVVRRLFALTLLGIAVWFGISTGRTAA